MLIAALLLTALVAAGCALLPAFVGRRGPVPADGLAALGVWGGVWCFGWLAYHRPGLAVGFDFFRLIVFCALTLWVAGCVCGLRMLRGARRALLLVPLVLGCELFVFNLPYFTTHSYTPVQLIDYLDPNYNVGRGMGTVSLDSDRTVLHFVGLDLPIYNLRLDGLTNDDPDLLHRNSTFSFTVQAADEANATMNTFGEWQVAYDAPRSHVLTLDLTGHVRELSLQARAYRTAHADFPVAITLSGITANAPRPLDFSLLRVLALALVLAAACALRPGSSLWHRPWLHPDAVCRAAGAVCGLVLAAGVVVTPFLCPGNTGLATAQYNTAFWDGHSTVSFVYQQYGALAHSLLNGRLDLEQDPPPELVAMENPYDPLARDAAGASARLLWDHAYYNRRYYVYFGLVPCLLFQLPFEAVTGIQNLAYAPCMVVLGLLYLWACFGLVRQCARRWRPQLSCAGALLSVAALAAGSQLYSLLLRPYIYEYAILCGAALLLVGLWQWMAAANTPVQHHGALCARLALGSLCVALVAGCRPQMELFAFLAVPMFWQRYVAQKRLTTRQGRVELAAFVVPVVLVAALLMWYNAARFGSVLDFGANYNLTGNDMTRRGFNPVRIAPAVFTSLLDPPRLKGVFPFIEEARLQTNAMIRSVSEPFCGGLLATTPWLWALAALALPAVRRTLRRAGDRFAVIAFAMAAAAAITVVDCQMAGVLYRYLMDFSPVLLLAAALCWWELEHMLQQRAAAQSTAAALLPALRVCMALAVAWSCWYRFCTLFAAEPWMQGLNAGLYLQTARAIQFWL